MNCFADNPLSHSAEIPFQNEHGAICKATITEPPLFNSIDPITGEFKVYYLMSDGSYKERSDG